MFKHKIQKYCNKINSLLEEKDIKGIVDVINEMEQTIPDSGLYWSRDVFIKCGCDSSKSWDIMEKYPNEFICDISDDMDEHPGIVMKFKNIKEDY